MSISLPNHRLLAALLLLGACGTDGASSEVVVADCGGAPSLLGVGSGAVFWTVRAGAGTQISGSSLASLPAERQSLGDAPGPVAQVGDHVLVANDGAIFRAGLAGPATKVLTAAAETLTESEDDMPTVAWTNGPNVMWGNGNAMSTAPLSKITRSTQLQITATSIYVGADGVSERRILRINRRTGDVTPLAASSTFAEMFPDGGKSGATYYGRLVGADATAGLWLVEERAAGATSAARAILVSIPEQGAPSVVLDRIGAVTAFFATTDGFYWQEGDALLSAPKSGGAAAIEAHIPGQAGAVADGFVYYATGTAIERLAVD